MKTKSKRKTKKPLPHPALDLFGEVPVTVQDCEQWVAVVAPRWYGSRRMQMYMRDWNVPGKVAQAKLAGWFDQVKADANEIARCEGCIGRFAL